MPGPKPPAVELTEDERRELVRLARGHKTGQQVADLPVAARLADAPRSGTPARITPEQVARIMALACAAPGESGRPISQWSTTELAREIVRRGIVETISPRHAARLLKRGSSGRT